MPRSKNISEEDEAEIISVLDGWDSKLTWEAYRLKVNGRLLSNYTRQTLHKHPRIHQAFKRKKLSLVEGPVDSKSTGNARLDLALQQIQRLEAEKLRLEETNALLLDQFRRWLYNADVAGVGPEQLDKPLPPLDRRSTVKPKKARLKPIPGR